MWVIIGKWSRLLPTRLSFWRKKNSILYENWDPCAYQAERLPKCFMNYEIMNIIAILLLNNNIISLNNGLHYVVVYIQICGWWDADSGVCQWASEPHRQTHAQDIFLGEELEPTTAESISPRLQREAEEE